MGKHLQNPVWVRYSTDVIFSLKIGLQMVSKVFTVFSFIISLLAFVSSSLKITLWIPCNNYCPKETLFSYVRKLKQVISFLLLPFINFSPYVKSENLE